MFPKGIVWNLMGSRFDHACVPMYRINWVHALTSMYNENLPYSCIPNIRILRRLAQLDFTVGSNMSDPRRSA